jgi:hypothetical protein
VDKVTIVLCILYYFYKKNKLNGDFKNNIL